MLEDLPLLAVPVDGITEIKEAEKKLRDLEEKYHLVVENVNEAILVVQDGKITIGNAQAKKIFGYPFEEFISRPLVEIIYPDHRGMMAEGRQKGLPGEKACSRCSLKIFDREGRVRWLEINPLWITWEGRPASLNFVRDVTERKQADEALRILNCELERLNLELEDRVKERTAEMAKIVREWKRAESQIRKSESMLQTIFEGISDPLAMLDRNLSVKMLNRAAKEYFHIKEMPEVIDKPCYRAFRGRPGPCEDCHVPLSVSNGRAFIFERKGFFDLERIEQVTVYSSKRGGKETGTAIIRISDITEAKLLEKQVMQNEKLASLGLLVSGIAHEINNSNNFVNFNVPILRDYLKELIPIIDDYARGRKGYELFGMSYKEFREDIFKLLDNIEHGAQRTNTTVSTLKEFTSGRDQKEKCWIDLKFVIEKGVAISHSHIKKSVKSFVVEMPQGLPPIFTNPVALEQVLVNLLINAAQAADKEDSWIKLRVSVEKTWRDHWILEVIDNGCGMDEKTRKKVFVPFFTTKKYGAGTGLGLYICQSIIEGLGGRIEAESEVGKGSTFRVVLPDADRRSKKRVLGLDPEPDSMIP
jgi:PAS domain S-box-containing protein